MECQGCSEDDILFLDQGVDRSQFRSTDHKVIGQKQNRSVPNQEHR